MLRAQSQRRGPNPRCAPNTLRARPALRLITRHRSLAALAAVLAITGLADAQATRQVSRRSYKIIEIKRPDLRLTGGQFVLTEQAALASDGPVYPPDERCIVHTTGLVQLAPPEARRAWLSSVLRIPARGGQETALSKNPGPTLTEQPPPGIPPGAARAAGYPISSAGPASITDAFASR